MMFLDTEELIKRIIAVFLSVIILAGFGITFYYGYLLKKDIVQGQAETAKILEELNGFKETATTNTKQLKTSITTNVEETKKVDDDLKSQTNAVKQLQSDIKVELSKLKESNNILSEQLKAKEQQFVEQLKIRDNIIEKNKSDAKAEISNLRDLTKTKDKEIADLKSKLDKEIDWRNRNFFNR